MASHHASQGFWFTASSDGLAAADAHISEDPQVDAAGQDGGHSQKHEADEGARAHDEGGVDGVIAGHLG